MLPDIVNFLYELLHGDQDPVYEDKIYLTAAITLVLSALALGIIFYYLLNGFRAKYSKTWPWWWLFLIATVVFNFVSVLFIAHDFPPAEAFSAVTFGLCFINAAYSAVVFFFLSLLLKLVSPHASKTPF